MANRKGDIEREISDFQAILKELSKESEREVRGAVGRKNFLALQVFAFEYACKMAEALGIYQKRGENKERAQFLQMCNCYRRFVIDEVHESLRSSKERYCNKKIILPSNGELDEIVEKEYIQGKKINFVLAHGSLVYVSSEEDEGAETT
ncbi:MAG: hypothetical protein MUF61_00885 [archaeon]|jgi:hypothetical protein|nr:hypothetical protein [archaeon]